MELHTHGISDLFSQLGLPNDDAAIALFLNLHRPVASSVKLHEAVFWSPSQAAFLCEAILDDADWTNVVEELNADLHADQ